MLDNISRYVYEVYKCKSVSEAAKKLFLSQPALSASIKKAEENLGTPIFNRKTIPFTLTHEGELYINAIEKIMEIEDETITRIQDFTEMKSGTLRIGTATHLSFFAIPEICGMFRKKFPHIDISIIMDTSSELPALLEKDIVDMIFTYEERNDAGYGTKALFEEKYIIALRRDSLKQKELESYALCFDEIINRSYPIEKEISDMNLFHGMEFVYTPHSGNIYKKKKMLFGESDMNPYITSSTGRQVLNFNLMYSGFGALFTTDAVLATMPEYGECCYFALKNPEAKQNFNIMYRKDNHTLSEKIIAEFLDTATEIFHTENPLMRLKRK